MGFKMFGSNNASRQGFQRLGNELEELDRMYDHSVGFELPNTRWRWGEWKLSTRMYFGAMIAIILIAMAGLVVYALRIFGPDVQNILDPEHSGHPTYSVTYQMWLPEHCLHLSDAHPCTSVSNAFVLRRRQLSRVYAGNVIHISENCSHAEKGEAPKVSVALTSQLQRTWYNPTASGEDMPLWYEAWNGFGQCFVGETATEYFGGAVHMYSELPVSDIVHDAIADLATDNDTVSVSLSTLDDAVRMYVEEHDSMDLTGLYMDGTAGDPNDEPFNGIEIVHDMRYPVVWKCSNDPAHEGQHRLEGVYVCGVLSGETMLPCPRSFRAATEFPSTCGSRQSVVNIAVERS